MAYILLNQVSIAVYVAVQMKLITATKLAVTISAAEDERVSAGISQ